MRYPRRLLLLGLLLGGCAPLRWPAPPPAPLAIETRALVGPAEFRRWHRAKAAGGPTWSGNAAWRAHVEDVEARLRALGVVELARDPVAYPRWWTGDDPAEGDWSLAIDGEAVPVASYWAYSGSTGPAGVTAPLAEYRAGLPPGALAGRIVVFTVPALGDPIPAALAPAGHAFATADLAAVDRRLTTDHWYQVNYATRFGRLGALARESGAAGALVVFDMGAARAAGIYTFPLLEAGEVGVPGLYLDRAAGATVLAAARAGRSATLRLVAGRGTAEAWFLSGVLPGRDHGTARDEEVLLVTHTDGPNLTQENGALGIVAMVRSLARTPRAARRRSVRVLLDPQHYAPGRHLVDWYARHPAETARIVASVGVEQLGQREYVERGDRFEPTGAPETTILFTQDNPQLVDWAVAAIRGYGLPRTELRVPARGGQGRWFGLGDVAVSRRWPGYGSNTEMSAYWSTRPGLESFDAELAVRQLAVLTALTQALRDADLPALPGR